MTTREVTLPVYMAAQARRGDGATRDPEIERVRKFARVLDHYLVDPIMGFVLPGAGDLIGSLLGLYIVATAVRRKMSHVVIARMLLNLTADAALGIIPLVGRVADIAFQANAKNVALLGERAAAGGKASVRDWLLVISMGLAFVAVLGLAIYGIVALFRAIA